MAKLFAGCIASRVGAWIEVHELLSPAQKGFLRFDGAFENIFLFEQALQRARHLMEEFCAVSLDIKNAFGSVPHQALFYSLKAAGIGNSYLELIKDLYIGTTTSFLLEDQLTDPVPLLAGVRQGCPLSGLLFNFVIDQILREVQGDCEDVSVLAFADDIFLLHKSPAQL